MLGPLDDLSLADVDRVLDINVRGVFLASQAAAAQLGRGGRIITIGSCMAQRVPGPGGTLYAMSKAALTGLTKALARELGGRGITANLVHPGPIDTDMNPADGPYAARAGAMTALGRFGSAEEVASMVAYLAGRRRTSPGRSSGGRRPRGVRHAGRGCRFATCSPSGTGAEAPPGAPPSAQYVRRTRASSRCARRGGSAAQLLVAGRQPAPRPSSVREPNRRSREMPPSGKMSTRTCVPTAGASRTKRWLVSGCRRVRGRISCHSPSSPSLDGQRRPAGRVALEVRRVDLDGADLRTAAASR